VEDNHQPAKSPQEAKRLSRERQGLTQGNPTAKGHREPE